jgi:hypothetical protein
MVRLQNSISKCLHHHTFSNMLFDMISKTHHIQILSWFGLGVGAWFTTRLTFPTFWLSSPSFSKCFKRNLDYHILVLQIMTFSTTNFDQKVPLLDTNKKTTLLILVKLFLTWQIWLVVFLTSWMVGYLTS